jgi:hypothetical protein
MEHDSFAAKKEEVDEALEGLSKEPGEREKIDQAIDEQQAQLHEKLGDSLRKLRKLSG